MQNRFIRPPKTKLEYFLKTKYVITSMLAALWWWDLGMCWTKPNRRIEFINENGIPMSNTQYLHNF